MKSRTAAIKNIAWALAIVLCLLAVFVGLLFQAECLEHSGQQPVHRSVKQIDRHLLFLFLHNFKFKHTKILISNGFCK